MREIMEEGRADARKKEWNIRSYALCDVIIAWELEQPSRKQENRKLSWCELEILRIYSQCTDVFRKIGRHRNEGDVLERERARVFTSLSRSL